MWSKHENAIIRPFLGQLGIGPMLPLHMPLSDITAERRGRFDNSSPLTRGLTRGVCRMLTETGFGPITEFRLPNRRRADVMGLGNGSEFVIVEVKSCVADFRSDA